VGISNATGTATAEVSAVLERQRERLFPWVKPYYADPLVLTEGSGVWVKDEAGEEYLDFFAGIVTTSVGHCHPEVVRRVQEQCTRLGHTSTL
jgi:alanine-glyoxylate transaminase / (R)-3-amino-2-methylpropionate-pyruvate transaminase